MSCNFGEKKMYLDVPIPTDVAIATPAKVSCMYSFKSRMATNKYLCKHGGGAEEGSMAHAAAEGFMAHAAAAEGYMAHAAAAEGYMAHAAAAEGYMAHAAAAEGYMAHAAAAEGFMAHAAAERAAIMY
ncbi:pupal cuticle protein G1A-like [Impatiens glandulifera]|uniref:pupal cuticle protein G1A-like n=1 Tax=Impatiens glandulifera TaxID=253017 RepID=UPI001FB04D10|nr:pupal cuticle protein G1A-like [Impatiens glandulifera]